MLYREIISVCSQIHTKHKQKKTILGQRVEMLNVKRGGTYSDHWALKFKESRTRLSYKYSEELS
jgi:hypothetical protein